MGGTLLNNALHVFLKVCNLLAEQDQVNALKMEGKGAFKVDVIVNDARGADPITWDRPGGGGGSKQSR
jgi:hypothetical protein